MKKIRVQREPVLLIKMSLSHSVEEVMGDTLERGYAARHCGFIRLHADFEAKLLVKAAYINHLLTAQQQNRGKCFT